MESPFLMYAFYLQYSIWMLLFYFYFCFFHSFILYNDHIQTQFVAVNDTTFSRYVHTLYYCIILNLKKYMHQYYVW
jgi:hypothetical protein